jgi:hypothetical protein
LVTPSNLPAASSFFLNDAFTPALILSPTDADDAVVLVACHDDDDD